VAYSYIPMLYIDCILCHWRFRLFSNEPLMLTVGIATGYGLDDRMIRVRFPVGAGNFYFYTVFRPALGPTQPPIQWLLGILSLGVKRTGRKADHSI